METLKLGHTNLFVTDIAFGAWAIGGSHWGPVDDQVSVQAIQAAIGNGCTFIDTAPIYGKGHSEEVVAKAMQSAPHTVKVATKCGLVWDDQGKVRINNQPDSIRREVRDSLKRLNVEVIDLYQVHWPDKRTPLEDTLAVMRELKDQGLVRYWGVCNYEGDDLRTCFEAGASTTQNPFNMIDRRAERSVLPLALEFEAGVLAYGPLARGLLTGKYVSPPTFPPDDIRNSDDNFKEDRFTRIQSLVKDLEPLAKALGKSLTQFSLAWVLSRPHNMVALAGARTPAQATQNLTGSGFKLNTALMAQVEELVQHHLPEALSP